MKEFELLPTSKNLLFDSALTDEELEIFKIKLWKLLAKRTLRYTMGDSSSIPAKTAQELLSSIIFTLEMTGYTDKELISMDFDTAFRDGLKNIEIETNNAKELLKTAVLSSPPIESISYHDTLKSIENFFKCYDFYFFAHDIPCDIDYQLCHLVPESLKGIRYISEYLKRIIVENNIIKLFDKNLVLQLLKSYCSDYKYLLINLCEPVIVNAIGLTIINSDPLKLNISGSKLEKLLTLFDSLNESKAQKALSNAAIKFCNNLGIKSEYVADYVCHTAIEIYPRISTVLPAGNLKGIFIPFE